MPCLRWTSNCWPWHTPWKWQHMAQPMSGNIPCRLSCSLRHAAAPSSYPAGGVWTIQRTGRRWTRRRTTQDMTWGYRVSYPRSRIWMSVVGRLSQQPLASAAAPPFLPYHQQRPCQLLPVLAQQQWQRPCPPHKRLLLQRLMGKITMRRMMKVKRRTSGRLWARAGMQRGGVSAGSSDGRHASNSNSSSSLIAAQVHLPVGP
mmetsp:Transcript_18947/g.40820  ORF Transcript_18947/g.40820 Transcript_18947/m.40820 type:complete len:202 (+) Transcript_18947:356-961(+)